MQCRLLFMFALLAAMAGCGKQERPRSASRPETTTYTLDICGATKIRSPTRSDIRQAVLGLDMKNQDSFLVLGATGGTYIQTMGDQHVGFVVEYQRHDTQHHYRAKRVLSADEIVKAFVLYSSGSDDWKKMTDWEKMNL